MHEINKLHELVLSHIVSKALTLALEMKLHEILSPQPTNIDSLARRFNCDPQSMKRFFRLLEAYEIVETIDEHQVVAGKLLPYMDHIDSPHLTDSYQFIDNLSLAIASNHESYSKTFGKPFYPHLLENPKKLDIFKRWCTQSAQDWLPIIDSIYDFSKFKKIVDVGGGEGYFLASILSKNPQQQGILFDLPSVVSNSPELFKVYNVDSRVEIMSGDFFKSLPSGADAYIICRTLLNWNDQDSLRIINNCYAAMNKSGTLLIIDFVTPEKTHAQYKMATLSDINLLNCINSAIRTKNDWQQLVSNSKFHLNNIHITADNAEPQTHIPMIVLELTA